jgi:hypothetical protein
MRVRNLVVFILVVIHACTCDEDTPVTCPENPLVCLAGSGVTLDVDVASASPQQALVGSLVAQPPAIRVSDGGAPVQFCTVSFEIVTGGGSLSQSSELPVTIATTDAGGRAGVPAWKLGPSAGGNTVRASMLGCLTFLGATFNVRSSVFEAQALAPTPEALVKVAGDNQTAAAGDTTRVRLKVRLTGQQGLGVASQRITFRVINGLGTIGGAPIAAVDTDRDGYAECPLWRMGARPGAEAVEASFGTLPPVVFTLNSTAGAPHAVAASTTPAGAPGAAASPVPEVLVTDANANPVPNAAVLFEVLAGGGTVGGGAQASTTTDANGKARPASWVFGMNAGLNRLRASVLRNNQLDANVQGNPVSFDVTTTTTGAVTVRTTIYGIPRSGVGVTLMGAASRTGATTADGTITFSGLPAGQYIVTIAPPSGTFFSATSQSVSLAASQTVLVEFDGHGAAAGRASAPISHILMYERRGRNAGRTALPL